MIRFFVFMLLLCFIPDNANSRVVKLGGLSNQQNVKLVKRSVRSAIQDENISCLQNEDCSFDSECVALQCESVCKHISCVVGTYCAPAGKDNPHTYQCVECITDIHCKKGMFCDTDYKCKKRDPCLKAVCSPAAPFCLPKPYQTLPYTCVQCLENKHCPPVAGLTRRCEDGYCLFNVEGNVSMQETVVEKKDTSTQYQNVYDISYENEIEYDTDIEYEDDKYLIQYE